MVRLKYLQFWRHLHNFKWLEMYFFTLTFFFYYYLYNLGLHGVFTLPSTAIFSASSNLLTGKDCVLQQTHGQKDKKNIYIYTVYLTNIVATKSRVIQYCANPTPPAHSMSFAKWTSTHQNEFRGKTINVVWGSTVVIDVVRCCWRHATGRSTSCQVSTPVWFWDKNNPIDFSIRAWQTLRKCHFALNSMINWWGRLFLNLTNTKLI